MKSLFYLSTSLLSCCILPLLIFNFTFLEEAYNPSKNKNQHSQELLPSNRAFCNFEGLLTSSTPKEQELLTVSNSLNTDSRFLKEIGGPTSDESGSILIQAQDGSLYIGGSKGDSIFLINLSTEGVILWQRSFDIGFSLEYIHGLIEDSDGNLVACGFSGTAVPYKGFVFKFDPISKTILWNRSLSACTTFTLIEKNVGGNYIISTHIHNAPTPGLFDDAGLIELNRNTGTQTNNIDKNYSYGSSETFYSLIKHNNELYTSGRYTQAASFGGFRGSVSKLDISGNPQWSKMNLKSLSSTARMYSFDMLIHVDSIVAIYFGDKNGTNYTTSSFFLSKADMNGNINWAKEYSIPSFSTVSVSDIEKFENGYLIYGSDKPQGAKTQFIARVDAQGHLIWAYSYGAYTAANRQTNKMLVTNDSTIFFVGTTNTGADNNILFAKLRANGLLDDNNTCNTINPLSISVSNFVNPVTTDVGLVVYSNPVVVSNQFASPMTNPMLTSLVCESICPEICNNGVDDDNNGLIDCYDPNCPCYYCDGASSNNWYFGYQAAIEFSSGSPVALTNSSMGAAEGVASISDQLGNLLFYTNGRTVWDASHNTMLNGTGLAGSNISAQSAIILPLPQNDSIYVIFTVPNWTDPIASLLLSYSYVNINGNGGLGEVTSKNITIHTGVSERISATLHENCRDIWILVHEQLNNNFVAYLLSPSGISANSVISSIGSNSTGNNRYGGLRFSHDGKKLCSTLGGSTLLPTVELFDFDNSTGIVSNVFILEENNGFGHAYSSEFSKNNKVLYVCEFNGKKILQYNLNLNPSLISASATNIASPTSIKSALQIGPDGKIYIAKPADDFLGVIDQPNTLGINCNYINNGVDLLGRSARIGLPNFLPNLFQGLVIDGPLEVCPDATSVSFSANKKTCKTFGYQWWISGDASIQSVLDSVVIVDFGYTGQVILYAQRFDLCDTLLDSLVITIDCASNSCTANLLHLDLGPDSSICKNSPLTLNASNNFDS